MNNLLELNMFDRMYFRAGVAFDFNEGYMEMVNRRIDIFADYSYLPTRFVVESIDLLADMQSLLARYGSNVVTDNTTMALKKLMPIVLKDYMLNYKNFLINCPSFKLSGFMCAKIMEEYVTQQIIKDDHFGTILYIDTDLLVKDYKELFNMNNSKFEEYSTQLTYSREVLYKLIYTADYVFWDKFDATNTNFEKDRVYEILTRRYRDCLGNVFMTSQPGGLDNILRGVDARLFDVMNLENQDCFNCYNDVYIVERCKRDND